jgi:signal transduction histidine kinase
MRGPVDHPEVQKITPYFRRSDSAHRGAQKGWGLGLTLVKGLTETHGGELKCGARSRRERSSG